VSYKSPSAREVSNSIAFYKTMTTTGFKAIVFTEINPTSTTTPITMKFDRNGNFYAPAVYTLGPVTILTNSVSQPPPGTPATPTELLPITVTETVNIAETQTLTVKSSASLSHCEFGITVVLFLITTIWLIVPIVR
jgi:hypothetical protein